MTTNKVRCLTPVAGLSLLMLVLGGLVVLWTVPAKAANISLNTCDEVSLKQAITNASKGDIITFNCGGNAVINLNQTITIEKDLTIDGAGQQVTLDGQHKTGIFQVNFGVAFTIQDLSLTNSQSVIEGAILNRGTLSVIHSTFSNNNVDHVGGNISNYGTLIVANSIFSNNSVNSDGAAGIYNDSGTLNITDSTFSGNSASHGNASAGGIFNLGGTLTVTNSTFSDNTAKGTHSSGGSIFNSGGTLTVTNSSFSGNISTYSGGIFNSGGTLTVTNSSLSGNMSNSLGGGGIYHQGGTLTVTDSKFTGNNAGPSSGGGIYNQGGNLIIRGATFSDNVAGYDGGGIYNSGGTLTLTNSTLTNNRALDGGGIFSAGIVTITNSTFSGNQSGHHGIGGGILNSGTLNISNSTFSQNSAPDGTGGAIQNGGSLTVTNSTFSGNAAKFRGAGLYNAGDVSITSATFSDNNALNAVGNTIYSESGTLKLKNSIIANASANNCFGSLSDQGYNLEYSGGNSNSCGFTNHPVTGDPLLTPLADNGGSTPTLALMAGSQAIGQGTCNSGDTDQRGVTRQIPCTIGAYEYRTNTTLNTCDEPSLRTALAFASPGATLLFGCSGTITLSIIDGNALTINKSLTLDADGKQVIITSAGRGRVIKVASGITLKLNNLTISGGNAGRLSADYPTCNGGGGGGICNLGSTVILTNSRVSGSSSRNGGGILNLGGNLSIINSTISNNSAFNGVGGDCCGGGIASLNGSLTVTNSTFYNNAGGAIVNSNGVLTVTTSTFTDNRAVQGSGISHVGNQTATLTGNLIAGNIPTYSASYNYDLDGNFISGGYNLVGNGDNSYGLTNGVNNDRVGTSSSPINPLLAPLANNGGPTLTVALLPGSPALDRIPASASFCGGTTDQRGVSRPQGGNCDIGALEQLPPTPSLDSFNRPDGPMGNNWIGNTNQGFYRVVANEVRVGNSGFMYWNSNLGANQEVAYTFTRIATNATEHDLLLKGDGGNPMLGTAHLIEVQYNPARKEVRINTLAPGRGWYTHIRYTGVNFVAGDRFRAKAYSSGLVEVYQNEKFIGGYNVTTGPKAWPKTYATAGGYAGVWFIGNFLNNEARFDNFGGGNF